MKRREDCGIAHAAGQINQYPAWMMPPAIGTFWCEFGYQTGDDPGTAPLHQHGLCGVRSAFERAPSWRPRRQIRRNDMDLIDDNDRLKPCPFCGAKRKLSRSKARRTS